MDSGEFSHMIGHNYVVAIVSLPQDHFALQHNDEASLHIEDVALLEPLSPNTLARIQEQNLLILNDGFVRQDTGPIIVNSISSQGSHKGGSPGEISSIPQNIQSSNNAETSKGAIASGNTPKQTHFSANDCAQDESLEALKDNFIVKEGVPSLNVAGETSTKKTDKLVILSSLAKNIPGYQPHSTNVSFTYNEDGNVNLIPSDEFLDEGRKQWDTSIIGHFIGSSFDFKFVSEKTMKLWKNKGLSRVYYSSRGYFTLRFGTIAEKDAVLALNAVQIGGKTLYLKPWMEGSKFRNNVIAKVPCWIKLINVPHSYWSRKGLTTIAETIGPALKFDEATSKFEPLKFARVQIELSQSAPRPQSIFVPIKNFDGDRQNQKVDIEYL